MSLASWVSSLFRREQPAQQNDIEPLEQLTAVRRWESAQTTRLNQEQWRNVHSNPINADLLSDRSTLVARSRYERQNNPIVEGVVDSYALDVVGESGPTLIVECEGGGADEYKAQFQKIWCRVWNTLEASGMSGTDLLTRLVGQDWDNGDWLQQIVPMEEFRNEPVMTRLLDIDPERLSSDPRVVGHRDVVMGIKRSRYGRPQSYYIRNPEYQFDNHFYGELSYNWEEIPADDILHTFVSREPGQARGFPSLASCLQEMADLRDYDYQTLDAARMAANFSAVMWTNDPTYVDAESNSTVPDTINLERQTIKKMPAGYQPMQMQPNNPTAQYIDFRHEKLRSVGRVKHMPLLMVLLSAEDSNFSQSRIDLNVIYERGLRAYRRWIERNWLLKIVAMVKREAQLAARPGARRTDPDYFLLPKEPEGTTYTFGWEPIAQANPKDAAEVQEKLLAMSLTTPEWEHAKNGTSEDAALASIARTNSKRKTLGLDPVVLGDPQPIPAPMSADKPGDKDKPTPKKERRQIVKS